MVPQQDVIAEEGFTIPKSDAELAQEREEAAAAVAPIFRYDPRPWTPCWARAAVPRARRQRGAPGRPTRSVVRTCDACSDCVRLPREHRGAGPAGIVPENRPCCAARWSGPSVRSCRRAWSPAATTRTARPAVALVREGTERLLAGIPCARRPDLYSRAAPYLPPASPPGLADFQRLVVILFFEGSIRLDRVRTEAAREQAGRRFLPSRAKCCAASEWSPRTSPSAIARSSGSTRTTSSCRVRAQLGAGQPHALVGMFMLNLMSSSIFGFLLLLYRSRTSTATTGTCCCWRRSLP
jgi:hypothetical protein